MSSLDERKGYTERQALVSFLEEIIEEVCELSSEDLSIQVKIKILESKVKAKEHLSKSKWLSDIYESNSDQTRYVILSLIAIGQDQSILCDPDTVDQGWLLWNDLMTRLGEMESFYESVGGIIGYHLSALRCMEKKEDSLTHEAQLEMPEKIETHQYPQSHRRRIQLAIENWAKVGLMIPIGGAGDRLGLLDKETQEPLPSAFMPFSGHNLFEGILKDLEAIEALVWQVTGKRVVTPLALMTSEEKGNHRRIEQYLKDHDFLGRPQSSIRLFCQMGVPLVSESGAWVVTKPLCPAMKPGGHGVIWRLAEKSGVFDWLKEEGIESLLVRQINNPLAGMDSNLLGLVGEGMASSSAMGFLSCDRLVHTAEGVLVKKIEEEQSHVVNIEYTDFSFYGIDDVPINEQSSISKYPSNTNVLFLQLDALRKAVEKCPVPGLIINFKNVSTEDSGGGHHFVRAGRLESTMQSISESLENKSENKLPEFVLYGPRWKVMSAAKKRHPQEGYAIETAASAFYDLQQAWRQLLTQYCQFNLPLIDSMQEYYHGTPPLVCEINPLLGPLFDLISQKIQGGTLASYSTLKLDLMHLIMKEVYLEGGMEIVASDPETSSVRLSHVTVVNKGWSGKKPEALWETGATPSNKLKIELGSNSHFRAGHLHIEGDQHIEVPDDHIMNAYHDIHRTLRFDLESVDGSKKFFGVRFEENSSLIYELNLEKSNYKS